VHRWITIDDLAQIVFTRDCDNLVDFGDQGVQPLPTQHAPQPSITVEANEDVLQRQFAFTFTGNRWTPGGLLTFHLPVT